MRTQTKIFLLLALVILVIAVFAVSSGLILKTEDAIYLTPIPYSTLYAYQVDNPVNSKLEAVVAAHQFYIVGSRLEFTQGPLKVVSVEKMKVDDARKLTHVQYQRPGEIEVWLVTFEGSWQLHPPHGDLLPVEMGCIYVIIETNAYEYGHFTARDCIPLP